MTEQDIQAKLIKQYESQGWTVLKLMQLNKAGYPDLLCLMPYRVKFVEVKGPKGRLSKVQKYRIAELKAAGFDVEVAFAPI